MEVPVISSDVVDCEGDSLVETCSSVGALPSRVVVLVGEMVVVVVVDVPELLLELESVELDFWVVESLVELLVEVVSLSSLVVFSSSVTPGDPPTR